MFFYEQIINSESLYNIDVSKMEHNRENNYTEFLIWII